MSILTAAPESGNIISCEEMCERYYSSVRVRVTFLISHNLTFLAAREELVDDLVQETFYHAVRSYARLQHDTYINAWLWRIATNVVYDYLRRYKSQRYDALSLEDILFLPDESSDPAELYSRMEFDGPFDYAWCKTIPKYQQVLLLLAEGYKPGEVAELLGMTKLAVYTTLREARRSFKHRYKKCQEVA